MSVMEKALGLIGLERMTNREVLLEDLAALSPSGLYEVLADNRLTQLIDDMHCEDCHRLHGGKCPKPDEADCDLSTEAWLERACEREHLIGVVEA